MLLLSVFFPFPSLTTEQLESIYRVVSAVSSICVYADGDHEKPIALVVPNESVLEKIASENGIQTESVDELLENKKLNSIVLKEMQNTAKQYGLSGIEIIQSIVLVGEQWNPENVSDKLLSFLFFAGE